MRKRKDSPAQAVVAQAVVVSMVVAQQGGAQAAELLDNDRFVVRWDNSIKYTLGARTLGPSAYFTDPAVNPAAPNLNDGDAAFKKGDLITNRLDLLSEFDMTAKDRHQSGLRISAAAWYDRVYRGSHEPVDPATYNQNSVPNTEFNSYARKWSGANAEIYDAFVHSAFDLRDHTLSFRLGRHTLIWGESLLMPNNGIAAAQAPVDVTKVLTVPGLQAKDFLMPVNQLSAALSLSSTWQLQGYYQFEFRKTRVPSPGTYFSTADIVFDGAESLILGPGFAVPLAGTQKPPRSKGQWGVAATYRNPESRWDFGAYYLRYTAKTPQIYLQLTGIPGPPFAVPSNYFFVYPQNIEVIGVSTSTRVGDASVAGEISVRNNMPLVSNLGVVAPGTVADGRDNPLYAVGRTLHFQASTIWVVPRTAMWETAALAAEAGGNYLMKVTKNDTSRNTETARTTAGLSVSFEPAWYQVLPDVDVSMPITLAYNFNDKPSAIDPGFNGTGAAHGGSMSVGLKFNYANGVKGGLNYSHYLGTVQDNPYGDRDFITFNLNYSF